MRNSRHLFRERRGEKMEGAGVRDDRPSARLGYGGDQGYNV